MAINLNTNPDALPQLMGEFKPVDEWQAHISQVFYGLRAPASMSITRPSPRPITGWPTPWRRIIMLAL